MRKFRAVLCGLSLTLVLFTSQAYAITSVTAVQIAPGQVELIIQDAVGSIFWEGQLVGSATPGVPVTVLVPDIVPSNCLGTLQDALMTINGVVVENCSATLTQVPVTGQTSCFFIGFNPNPTCTGVFAQGQDGEVQAGNKAPVPRYTVNGDGTVTDELTGLVIAQNWNCFGPMNWNASLAFARNLADGQCGLTDGSVAGDWRLMNVKELQSQIDFGEDNPALPSGNPFINVGGGFMMWTSTTFVEGGAPFVNAWVVQVRNGRVTMTNKNNNRRSVYVRND